MKALAKKLRFWAPVWVTIVCISAGIMAGFGLLIFYSSPNTQEVTQGDGIYIVPKGIEALDLNIDAIKVIVQNESQIPLLDENSDYAYDGFISRANGTNIDIIFTVYDKTNSSLAKIPGIRHGPELIKILDNFIVHVDVDKKLMVYARR